MLDSGSGGIGAMIFPRLADGENHSANIPLLDAFPTYKTWERIAMVPTLYYRYYVFSKISNSHTMDSASSSSC